MNTLEILFPGSIPSEYYPILKDLQRLTDELDYLLAGKAPKKKTVVYSEDARKLARKLRMEGISLKEIAILVEKETGERPGETAVRRWCEDIPKASRKLGSPYSSEVIAKAIDLMDSGMSPPQVADALKDDCPKISPKTVGGWASGAVKPKARTEELRNLARRLNISQATTPMEPMRGREMTGDEDLERIVPPADMFDLDDVNQELE